MRMLMWPDPVSPASFPLLGCLLPMPGSSSDLPPPCSGTFQQPLLPLSGSGAHRSPTLQLNGVTSLLEPLLSLQCPTTSAPRDPTHPLPSSHSCVCIHSTHILYFEHLFELAVVYPHKVSPGCQGSSGGQGTEWSQMLQSGGQHPPGRADLLGGEGSGTPSTPQLAVCRPCPGQVPFSDPLDFHSKSETQIQIFVGS